MSFAPSSSFTRRTHVTHLILLSVALASRTHERTHAELQKEFVNPGQHAGAIAEEIARNTARNKVRNWPHANKCARARMQKSLDSCPDVPGQKSPGIKSPTQWNSFPPARFFARPSASVFLSSSAGDDVSSRDPIVSQFAGMRFQPYAIVSRRSLSGKRRCAFGEDEILTEYQMSKNTSPPLVSGAEEEFRNSCFRKEEVRKSVVTRVIFVGACFPNVEALFVATGTDSG